MMEQSHVLRRPVESSRALAHRKKTLALGVLLALGIAGALAVLLIGCGGATSDEPVGPAQRPRRVDREVRIGHRQISARAGR